MGTHSLGSGLGERYCLMRHRPFTTRTVPGQFFDNMPIAVAGGKILIGVNMEFVRHADKSFEWGVEKAAELGYQYIEPMVHWGRELLSEAGYFHSVSMLDDPMRILEGRVDVTVVGGEIVYQRS